MGTHAKLPGVTGLDLEALSFMGYDHNSLHDKRAVDAEPGWNACHCSVCLGIDRRALVLTYLFERIRAATKLPIDLRYIEDPAFYGGKTHIPYASLPGLVDSITYTFFGKAINVPSGCPVEANAGFVFHPPDTRSVVDLRDRYAKVQGCAGVGFYCYGLASQEHWNWLKEVITR